MTIPFLLWHRKSQSRVTGEPRAAEAQLDTAEDAADPRSAALALMLGIEAGRPA